MTFPEETAHVTRLLHTFDDPCIVDLGAQDGGDTAWMLDVLGRPARSVMVEVDKIHFEWLLARKLPGTAINAAIADHDGECDFWRAPADLSGFSSIYKPNQGLSVPPENFTKMDPVPCFTLDTIYREQKLDHIDLLWADIHGAEKEMIRHGVEAIRHTKYIFMEAMDWRMYEGAATKDELIGMLPGWQVIGVFPWNILLRNEGL